jgi:hypothetical protein
MLLPTKWSKNNSVHWDETSPCVAMRTDMNSSRVILFANNPIPSSDILPSSQSNRYSDDAIVVLPFEMTREIYYFEIEILSNVIDGPTVAIGIAPVDSDQQHDKMQMDTYNSFSSISGSVAYSNTGVIRRGTSSNTVIRFGTHDVIGCGCEIGRDKKVFFTCNGKIIPETHADQFNDGCHLTEKTYFPAVELLGIGTTIR